MLASAEDEERSLTAAAAAAYTQHAEAQVSSKLGKCNAYARHMQILRHRTDSAHA